MAEARNESSCDSCARAGPATIDDARARLPTRATANVLLGGSGVSSAGTWSHETPLARVSGKPGSLALNMPAGSAALVTLYPRG